MRRWSHLHTLMAGGLVGFGAATHTWKLEAAKIKGV